MKVHNGIIGYDNIEKKGAVDVYDYKYIIQEYNETKNSIC